jgi:hypothetical protein
VAREPDHDRGSPGGDRSRGGQRRLLRPRRAWPGGAPGPGDREPPEPRPVSVVSRRIRDTGGHARQVAAPGGGRERGAQPGRHRIARRPPQRQGHGTDDRGAHRRQHN